MTHTEKRLTWSLIALAYALLLALAIGARVITYERWLPVFDHIDESYHFIHAYQLRDDAPLGDSYGEIGWAQGFPPMQLWIAMTTQRIVEAQIPFPMPPDYVRILRQLSAIVNVAAVMFIAATAWRLALPLGNRSAAVAGWLAGVGWAVLPRVVSAGNHAIMDPLIFPTVAAAIFFTVYSLQTESAWSAFGALLAVILGIYLKYLVVYALWLPFCAVALLVWKRRWRMWPWITVMAIVSAATAGYLVFGHQALTLENREANIFYDEGIGNMFSPARNWDNLSYTLSESLGVGLFFGGMALGGAALFIRRRQGWPSVRLAWLWVFLPYMLIDLLLTSSVDVLSTWEPYWYRVRYTLPIAVGLMSLWGVALALVIDSLARWRGRVGQGLAVMVTLAVAAWIVMPSAITLQAQAQMWSEPHTLQVVWEYTDSSLEGDAGAVLVAGRSLLHKTWNRPWSGYNGAQTFRWEFSDTPEQRTAAEWQDAGFAYFAMTDSDRSNYFTAPNFDDWLSTLYPLKTIAPAGGSTDASTFYAFRAPDVQLNHVIFGETVALRGYDLNADSVQTGDTLTLRPYWQATQTPSANLSLFVHLLPLEGNIPAAQFDGAPTRLTRPSLTWDDPTETLIGIPATLTIPDNLSAGDYRLAIGLYDFTTGVRLQLDDERGFYEIPITIEGQ